MRSPFRLPTRPGPLAVLALLAAVPAGAHPALVGGFRPAAAERTARAVWTNPAAIGMTGRGAASADVVFLGDAVSGLGESGDSGDWKLPSDPLGFSLAASTDRLAYAWQVELEDRPGVPDWTFAVGNAVPVSRTARAGATVEWRAGDGGGLDAAFATQLRLGRSLGACAVVSNLLERGVDGADAPRSVQLGAVLRVRPALGRLTWDTVFTSGADDPVHWLGLAIDGAKSAYLSVARSSGNDWSATVGLTFPHHRLGIGGLDVDGAEVRPQQAFLVGEWTGREIVGAARRR
jgi:hypothetical protein